MPHKLHAPNQQDACREPQLGGKTALSYQKQLLFPGFQVSVSWDQNHQPQLFISTSGTHPDTLAGGHPNPAVITQSTSLKTWPLILAAEPGEVRRLHHLSAGHSAGAELFSRELGATS